MKAIITLQIDFFNLYKIHPHILKRYQRFSKIYWTTYYYVSVIWSPVNYILKNMLKSITF